jgi:hypothetical protein
VARGFCTCPQRTRGPAAEPSLSPCGIHPDGVDLPEPEREARGLVFYDDRRDRHVTWPDAVEAMRQDRYASAGNPGLVLFTWRNLLQLLAALRDPLAPDMPADEAGADALIAWAGAHLGRSELRWLLVFARGGGSAALCELFRFVASAHQNGID